MSYLVGSCDCSGNEIYNLPARCYKCGWVDTTTASEREQILEQMNETKQRRIWNTARVPASLYTMNLSTMNVVGDERNKPKLENGSVNWNQKSDRAVASVVMINVPRQRTRMIPGKQSAIGTGVDIKHNSYARYLARKKASALKQSGNASTPEDPMPEEGNKYYKLGIVAGCNQWSC